MTPPTEFKITIKTLNAILGYLGSRPYQEVFKIVQEIYAETGPQQVQTSSPADLEVVEGGNAETGA